MSREEGSTEAPVSAPSASHHPLRVETGADWLGTCPGGWKLNRLGYVARALSGGTPSKERPDFWDGEIPWVSPKDMKKRVLTASANQITPPALRESGLKIIAPPAVLIVVRGMILAHTFPVALTAAPVTVNQDMKALVPGKQVRAEFLAYWLEGLQEALLVHLVDEAAHGTKAIRMERWKNFPIFVPPTEEQDAIITFLDRATAEVDALLLDQDRALALLAEERTALLFETVTKGFDATAPRKESGEWFGQVPATWETGELGRFWEVIDCKHRTAQYVSEGIPIVSTTEVKPGRLDLTGARQTTERDYLELAEGARRPTRGDIIYSRNASVGSAAYVDTEAAFCMGQDVCLIRSKRQDQHFLSFQLNSPVVLEQLEAVMVGSTFRRVNVAQIKRLRVTCPPLEEQRAIAAYLDRETAAIDSLAAEVSSGIEKLKEFRRALIFSVVTGEIDMSAKKLGTQLLSRSFAC